MIKKFEHYNSDIDPYNEEDWDDKIYNIADIRIGDSLVNVSNPRSFGKVVKIGYNTKQNYGYMILTKDGREWDVETEKIASWLDSGIIRIEKPLTENSVNEKFEIGDKCYLHIGGDTYWNVEITKKGRDINNPEGYSYKILGGSGKGWSRDENMFVKELPPEPDRKYTEEDPYGEEEW